MLSSSAPELSQCMGFIPPRTDKPWPISAPRKSSLSRTVATGPEYHGTDRGQGDLPHGDAKNGRTRKREREHYGNDETDQYVAHGDITGEPLPGVAW
jgi:hypothetical protein